MPSKRAARLKRRNQKRREQSPKAKPPLVPDEFAAERRGMEIFLRQTTAFRLALALYNDPVVRDEVIGSLRDELAGRGTRLLRLDLREPSEEHTLLARVTSTIAGANLAPGERLAVMVVNLERHVDYAPELAQSGGPGTAYLENANLHRELFPNACQGPLVIWATELLERALVSHAPDLWHWRSHVFDLRTRFVPEELSVLSKLLAWSSDDYRRHPLDRVSRLEEELAAYRKIGSLHDQCHTLNAIGLARYETGDAKSALNDFELAWNIALSLKDNRNLAGISGNMGLAYAALGKLSEAMKCYQMQLDVALGDRDKYSESTVLGNIGNIYFSKGELQKAVECYERQLSISYEIGDKQSEGNARGGLGNSFLSLGDLSGALEQFEQALLIFRLLNHKRKIGSALGSLGNVYGALGEVQRAIGFHEQALELFRSIHDRRGEGKSLVCLGSSYLRLGNVDKAADLYQQQVAITREIGDSHGEGSALWNLAIVLMKIGKIDEAIQRGEEAVNAIEMIEGSNADGIRTTVAEWRKTNLHPGGFSHGASDGDGQVLT